MNIELISLALENFKCYENQTFRFDGQDAVIFGENGTGKSSVYDAFTWLLFGKNGVGESLTEGVKPVFTEGPNEGQVRDHAAVTAVEAVLRVDNVERSLKRTYFEVWSTKRGAEEATRDGHSSDYYVDGVPVKKNEFARRVGELVDEKIFRLLTSVSYFAHDLPWKERRATLFDLTRVADDRELMEGNGQFALLAEGIGDLPLDDYRKVLDARRKGLNKTRNDTPARLDECKKTVLDLSGINFAALEAQMNEARALRSAAQEDLDKAAREGSTAALREKLREVENQLKKLELDNQAHRLEQQKSQGVDETAALRQSMKALQTKMGRRINDLEYLRGREKDLEAEIAQYRALWDTIDNEQFTGSICPACGQKLPRDKLEAAMEGFEQGKGKRKERAVEAAKRAKTRLTEVKADITKLETERESDGQQWEALTEQLRAAEAAPKAEITDLEGFAENQESLEKERHRLEVELSQNAKDEAETRLMLHERVVAATAEVDRLAGELAKKTALEYAKKRMDELRTEAAAAADELNKVDKMIALCEAFTRYKAQFIEESVNRRFELVKFRLFRDQINGGLEDCCDVMVNGVGYNDTLNSGAKVRAGVDIINTLSRHYGVSVPLFLDGSESVTGPLGAATQTIRLRVSEGDKELRCNLIDKGGLH